MTSGEIRCIIYNINVRNVGKAMVRLKRKNTSVYIVAIICIFAAVLVLVSCKYESGGGKVTDSSTILTDDSPNNGKNNTNEPKDTTILTDGGTTSAIETTGVSSGTSTGDRNDTKLPETTVEPEVTTAAEETTVPAETTVVEVTTAPEETTSPSEESNLPWNLILVNPWNPVPDGYIDEVELVEVVKGYFVDARCAKALKQMLADCRAAGHTPYICSAYRTMATQEKLFNNMVKTYKGRGYSDKKARELAAKEVAIPGTSEHHLGLAVDIPCQTHPVLDDSQANTATQKWLMANCYKYGFILRYPKGKTDITGIFWEPWHYRYVGVEAATEITERGITLEEYLGIYGAIGD